MMRVPALCTALLFKNFKHQALAFQQKGSYVFHEQEVVGMDSMPYTIECTKSALGTKFFWAVFKMRLLKELSNSILELGIIQPVTVRKTKEEYFELISGERRYKASKMAGIE